jgi:membrane protease YdiL (CAAX protease family)
VALLISVHPLKDESPLIHDSGDDYWALSRQPLHSLLFLLPLLAVYEIGVARLGAAGEQARNGADYWMRGTIQRAGFDLTLALPGLVIVLLLGWQACARYRWSVAPSVLLGMLAESLLFGACLIVLGQVLDLAVRHAQPMGFSLSLGAPSLDAASKGISYLGAGIYEEVLFRLLLLTGVRWGLRLLLVPKRFALLLAIVCTSLLFSAAHYTGSAADTWSLQGFAFRALAGLVFSTLFVARGFGITVGAHAAYDLLVGVLLAAPAA